MAAHQCISVPRWPACLECVSWSADCEIVVASNETVDILIPKLSIARLSVESDEPEEKRWYRVRLLVNLFTAMEVPFIRPSSFSTFSIGEEQSTSNVVAVAWSQPGLAKHKRCALAVLTSNLVLSIWACDSDPTVSKDWKRVLVINQELKRGLEREVPWNRLSPLQCRVRSFTWSPSVLEAGGVVSEERSVDLFSGTDVHLIALSNDASEIVICEVKSPFTDVLCPQTRWTARPIISVGIQPSPTHPSGKNVKNYSRSAVNKLAWSPWLKEVSLASELRCFIAFSTDSILKVQDLILTLKGPAVEICCREQLILPLERRAVGFKWFKDTHSHSPILLSISPDAVTSITIPVAQSGGTLDSTVIFTNNESPLWNDIAGIAFRVYNGQKILDIAVDQAIPNNSKSLSVSVPLDRDVSKEAPLWLGRSRKMNESFSAERNLAHGATTRAWGLSSNSNNDHASICLSFHPRDMVHYTTASEQECILMISLEVEVPPQFNFGSSSESIAFSLSRYFGHKARCEGWSILELQIVEESLRSLVLSDPGATRIPTAISSSNDATRHIKGRLYTDGSYLGGFLDRISAIQNPSAPEQDEKPLSQYFVFWALSSAVFEIPKRVYKSSKLTSLILSTYTRTREFLIETWPAYFLHARSNTKSSISMNSEALEECDICYATIPFQNPMWATCFNGHQFVRCGFTLLAIQSPTQSKSCRLCSKRYFAIPDPTLYELETYGTSNLPFSEGGKTNEDVPVEQHHSLVSILQASCDTCIFCGGKFRIP